MPKREPLANPVASAESVSAEAPPAVEAETRPKRGKNGDPEQEPKDPVEVLYNALLRIGGKEKSIQIQALVKCEPLLTCPEVRRRAPLGASPEELARHARQALLDVIDNIVVPADRLVAQAALCTTEQFEGLRVTERQSLLMDLRQGRITPDVFKKRRPRVLHDIARVLQSAPMPTVRPSPNRVLGSTRDQRYKLSAVERLAYEAADLHYAGLLPLFIDQMKADGAELDAPFETWDALPSHLFQAFLPLVGRAERLEGDLASLTQRSQVTVAALLEGISDAGPPFSAPELEAIKVFNLGLEGWLTHPDGTMLRIYNDSWRPWYEDVIHDCVNRQNIEKVTAASGALTLHVLQSIDSRYPLLSEARHSALRVLAYYCDIPEYAPIFDGRSLRQLAEAYFDSAGNLLATKALQCYDKS